MSRTITGWIMLVLMVTSGIAAQVTKPTIYLAALRPNINLEALVPKQFGDWRLIKQAAGQIINPQRELLLQKLYTQTLERSYINSNGVVMMLSVAYGENQSDGVALHYPEVCYPAQGFQITDQKRDLINSSRGEVPVKRLMTKLGNRSEPVTYWAILGNKAMKNVLQTKFQQVSYGLNGIIPDGLIFRISNISSDSEISYLKHNDFINQLIESTDKTAHQQLFGL